MSNKPLQYILAFDTSYQTLSVVLKDCKNDQYIVTSLDAGRKHGELLLPEVISILEKAQLSIKDIDLIVTTRGPGSFTGLRIGMSTAKGLSQGAGIPVVSIPTLDYFSYGQLEKYPNLLSLMDGKKDRFYGTYYKDGLPVFRHFDLSPEEIITMIPSDVPVGIIGPDSGLFLEQLQELSLGNNCFDTEISYDPTYLITMGESQFYEIGPDKPTQGPLYIRKSQAEEALEEKV